MPQPLAPGEGRDPFEVLQVPRRFAQDRTALQRRLLELSRALHPDRFARATEVVRQASLDRMGLVNESHRLLADRDAIRIKVRFAANRPDLKLFVQYNPSAGGTPMSNHAVTQDSPLAPGPGLFAWDGDQAQALVASVPFAKTSVGFSGASDLYQDLSRDFRMDWNYREAQDGNVVSGAEIALPPSGEFELTLAFAPTIALARDVAGAALPFEQSLERYSAQWREYQSRLIDLSTQSLDGGSRFRASTAMLKSMEDKTFAGAVVASPSIPWGIHQTDWSRNGDPRWKKVGGYHLIWPRDLYQMATTWMAVGDMPSARAAFRRLRTAQLTPLDGSWEFGFRRHSRDGSFMQNFWIDGAPYWQGLQLDETAFPLLLAYRIPVVSALVGKTLTLAGY